MRSSGAGRGGWGGDREQVGRQACVSSLELPARLRLYAVCIHRSHGTPGRGPNNTEDTAAEALRASHFPLRAARKSLPEHASVKTPSQGAAQV